MREIDVRRTVLSNGLRIITMTRDSEVFSMGIGIKAGSLYEDRNNNGISHMVEHMLFKGTSRRTMDELNNDIEKLAGDMDIYTTYHQTVMTVNIMKDRAKECIDIVGDMLTNASFPAKELSLEKKVIMEEIKMAKDDPEDRSYLGLYKAAFPDTWYKYHIAGTLSSVKAINRDMLMEFYKSYYIPGNTVICIVSSFTHEEAVQMIERSMGRWDAGEPVNFQDIKRSIVPRKVKSSKKGIGQTHILYGFDADGLDRREEVALALINKKIGSGPNSLLFKELRDRKGYAYSVYSGMDLEKNIKLFYMYAAISEDNLRDSISIMDDVILRFKNGDIMLDEEGIRLIKDMFLTDVAIAMESPSHIVDYMLDGELNHNNPLEYQNVLSIMDTIDLSLLKSVIQKVLKDPIINILSPR